MARFSVSINVAIRKEGDETDLINETITQLADADIAKRMPWAMIMQEFWAGLMERLP